jgi:hypothetical protein
LEVNVKAALAALGVIGMLGGLFYVMVIGVPAANAEKPTEAPLMEMVQDAKSYNIMRHIETGCHYIETGGSSGSFTQMIGPDGKPFCPPDERLSSSF